MTTESSLKHEFEKLISTQLLLLSQFLFKKICELFSAINENLYRQMCNEFKTTVNLSINNFLNYCTVQNLCYSCKSSVETRNKNKMVRTESFLISIFFFIESSDYSSKEKSEILLAIAIVLYMIFNIFNKI